MCPRPVSTATTRAARWIRAAASRIPVSPTRSTSPASWGSPGAGSEAARISAAPARSAGAPSITTGRPRSALRRRASSPQRGGEPMLLGPGGKGADHDIAGPQAMGLDQGRGALRLPRAVVDGHLERRRRQTQALGQVQVLGPDALGLPAAGQGTGHEPPAALPGAQPDPLPGPGEPGQDAALEQPLQVQGQVEAPLAQVIPEPPHRPGQVPPAPFTPEVPPLRQGPDDDLIQVRVLRQQGGKPRLHQPGDARLG